VVTGNPTNKSYQGLPPDLTNVKFEWTYTLDGVVKTESISGKTDKELRDMGFFGVPDWCDEPGTHPASTASDGADCGAFYLGIGNPTGYFSSSNELVLPGVVWLNDVSGTSTIPFYSDRAPDFTDVELTFSYMYKDLKPYGDPSGQIIDSLGTTVAWVDKRKVTASYPKWDVQGAPAGTVEIQIGKSGGPNPIRKSIPVTYYQISGIVVEGWTGDFYMFDDDIQYADKTTGKAALEEWVAKAKPTFTVYYEDGKNRTGMTWDEFKKNKAYAKSKTNAGGVVGGATFLSPGDTIFAYGSTKNSPTYQYDGSKVLLTNEDDQWSFQLEYVPWEMNGSSPPLDAFVVTDAIDVPVAMFSELLPAKRVTDFYTQNNILVRFRDSIMGAMPTEVLNQIKTRWRVSASYEGGYTKEILNAIDPATASMFYLGVDRTNNPYGAASVNFRVSNTFSNQAEAIKLAGASSGYVDSRDWPLPIYYRGQILQEDDTVLVNIFYRED